MTPRIPQEKMSPDMHPLPGLPIIPLCQYKRSSYGLSNSDTTPVDEKGSYSESVYVAPHTDLSKWRNRPSIGGSNEGEGDPESPSVATSSSLVGSGLDGEEYTHIRMDSPPPLDEALADIKNERRYRMLLQHEFHPSRKFLLVQARG